MTIQEIKELALHSVKGTAPTEFTVEQVDAALLDGLKSLAGSINSFMKNRYDIYDIIIQAAEEVVPNKVIDALGIFAEVRQVPQGQKVIFKKKLGRARAKTFLTQVGLSGVYETFRLDSETFTLGGHAIGGAVTIDFERMLDNAEVLSELMEILTEGLVDSVYIEVQKCLDAAIKDSLLPAANQVESAVFDGKLLQKLVGIVKSYGDGAVIFAPPEFVTEMGPDAIVPVATNQAGVYHPQDIDAIHNQGYINIFRGTPIVMMKQSYSDETNSKVVIRPDVAYVLPTGKDRIVKVVLEGETQISDFKNRDNSMEIHCYKKIGAAILSYNDWAAYSITSIKTRSDDSDLAEKYIPWDESVYGNI